jgi:hypothetical protein
MFSDMKPYRLPLPLVAALLLAGCSSNNQVKPRNANMGERVELGHIIYTVFETQWLTKIGEGVDAKVPQNRYFLVRLSAANSSNAPVMVPAMTLEDDQGKTYNELTDGRGVPQWIGLLREVKTAEAAQGNVVFDVTPGHYKLRVTDEDERTAALIDIPLSLGSELPETSLPGSEKK